MSKQEVLKVVPARYPLRLIGALFSLFILAAIVQSVAGNARWEWGVFAEWFFAPAVLAGLGQTLLLTLLGTLFSILFGTLLALARLSRSYLLASLAWGYIWLFRSLPLILVLIILYNFSYLYDAISLGIPFTSVVFASFPTIDILGQFAVAVLGLTLVQSAYTAEIIRGGILGVDYGQHEAAAALGLPGYRRTFRIILPQALRRLERGDVAAGRLGQKLLARRTPGTQPALPHRRRISRRRQRAVGFLGRRCLCAQQG